MRDSQSGVVLSQLAMPATQICGGHAAPQVALSSSASPASEGPSVTGPPSLGGDNRQIPWMQDHPTAHSTSDRHVCSGERSHLRPNSNTNGASVIVRVTHRSYSTIP